MSRRDRLLMTLPLLIAAAIFISSPGIASAAEAVDEPGTEQAQLD